MSVTPRLMTADELQRLPRDPLHRYELVRGQLVRMPPIGAEHGEITAGFGARLLAHVGPRRLGKAMVAVGYRMTTDPDTVRAPDISFITADRVPPSGPGSGFVPGPPDLAVEVISPEDLEAEIDAKVQEYLAHGTRLVLVIYPRTRSVRVYHPDGHARILRSGDAVDGQDVVPGFSLPVEDIFPS